MEKVNPRTNHGEVKRGQRTFLTEERRKPVSSDGGVVPCDGVSSRDDGTPCRGGATAGVQAYGDGGATFDVRSADAGSRESSPSREPRRQYAAQMITRMKQ
uniref:Uncharacterized protein n=1 Tax=Oryza glumipatula TaxID=40148 RepID=A0A0E0BKY7_9ORYZ